MRFSLHDSTLLDESAGLYVLQQGSEDSSTSQKTKGPKPYSAPSPSVLNLESNPYD